MYTRTFTIPVTAESPTWLTNQAASTWAAIPGTSTYTLQAAGAAQATICTGWNGSAIDQSRAEILMVAGGGHGTYTGNEGYALHLNTPNPRWYKLNESTPPASRVTWTTGDSDTVVHQYLDGRAPGMHTCGFPVYASGKLWLMRTGSLATAGRTVAAGWSFDRNTMPTAWGQTPQAWANNAGPWTSLGHDAQSFISNWGQVAYDRTTGRLWSAYANDRPQVAWYDPASGTKSGTGPIFTGERNIYFRSQPAVTTASLTATLASGDILGNGPRPILITFDQIGGMGHVCVMDLNNTAAGFAKYAVSGTQPPILAAEGYRNGYGAVYWPKGRQVLLCNAGVTNGFSRIYALSIPHANGVFNPADTFTWATIVATGAPTTSFDTNAGSYTKFNIAEDVSGMSCLTMVYDWASPTYVYKLPNGAVS